MGSTDLLWSHMVYYGRDQELQWDFCLKVPSWDRGCPRKDNYTEVMKQEIINLINKDQIHTIPQCFLEAIKAFFWNVSQMSPILLIIYLILPGS